MRIHTYLGGGNSLNFQLGRTYKDLSRTLSHIPQKSFVKVLGLVREGADMGFQRGVNQALQTFHLLLLEQ